MNTEATNLSESPVAKEAFFSDVPAETEALVTPAKENLNKGYTEHDLQKVREQEKSKLYPQIDSLKEELNALKREADERKAEAERLRLEAEAEAKRKAESEMDTRQLLEVKEKEWAEKLEQERQERTSMMALLEKEREFAQLNEYRSARVSQEQENILPELLDLITGNTADEIESSISGLKDRTSRILDNTQQAMQSARKEMTGSRITSPASGPLDTNSDQQQFTAEQIAAMSVTEYAKYRGKLLPNVSQGNKGIFG